LGSKSREEKFLSQLQQERAELNELKLQNLQLNEKLLLKDDIINKKDSEIKAIQADRESLFEDVRKVYKNQNLSNFFVNNSFLKTNAKLRALELYASEIQRKLDLAEFENSNKQTQLQDLLTQDWARALSESNVEINKFFSFVII
jgi:hypothetical protein